MIYKITFTIDNGCREEQHIAIVNADSSFGAIHRLEQCIVLGYDEYIVMAKAEPIENGSIIYCSYKCRPLVDIKNLPKEFNFKSNINPLNILYHATERENDYVVTSDGGCLWYFDKAEIHRSLLTGDYVIIKEELK